jgi:hypothetical protein
MQIPGPEVHWLSLVQGPHVCAVGSQIGFVALVQSADVTH